MFSCSVAGKLLRILILDYNRAKLTPNLWNDLCLCAVQRSRLMRGLQPR
jgi:hypothetical protein